MRSGKHRGQKKQKRKGAYDKSGGITHDTAAFAFRTKDILKIRSRPRLEPGSDYHYLVRVTGLEPDNTIFYMFFLVLICAKMQKTSRLFLIVIRLNMAYIFL